MPCATPWGSTQWAHDGSFMAKADAAIRQQSPPPRQQSPPPRAAARSKAFSGSTDPDDAVATTPTASSQSIALQQRRLQLEIEVRQLRAQTEMRPSTPPGSPSTLSCINRTAHEPEQAEAMMRYDNALDRLERAMDNAPKPIARRPVVTEYDAQMADQITERRKTEETFYLTQSRLEVAIREEAEQEEAAKAAAKT